MLPGELSEFNGLQKAVRGGVSPKTKMWEIAIKSQTPACCERNMEEPAEKAAGGSSFSVVERTSQGGVGGEHSVGS